MNYDAGVGYGVDWMAIVDSDAGVTWMKTASRAPAEGSCYGGSCLMFAVHQQ